MTETEPEPAPEPLEPLPPEPRRCAWATCGQVLERKKWETLRGFTERKFCSAPCAQAAQKARSKHGPKLCSRCGERPRRRGQGWCARCQAENRKRLRHEARQRELVGPEATIHALMNRDTGPRVVRRDEAGQLRPVSPGRPFLGGAACTRCRDLAEKLSAATARATAAEAEVARLQRTLDARGPAVLVRTADSEAPAGDPYAGHGPTCPCPFCAGADAYRRHVESITGA